MKVEVWSDFVCPFCYIGKKQLEKAIQDTGYFGQVEVELKSFLLDPTTLEDSDEYIYEHLSKKYGMPIDEVMKMTNSVVQRANEVGLQYNFDELKTANTLKAHRLSKWAYSKGKGIEFSERVFHAYFIEGKAIGKEDVLIKLAEEVGLESKEVEEILKSNRFSEEVEKDIQQAQIYGIQGVPFFVFENKYAISGAQPQELFEQTVKKVAEEKGLKPSLQMLGGDGDICSDGHCDI
ncbi:MULTISPECIES: DsbA family oxidoreductase [Ureibacillus]|jgi:predicted DsbA family dithiol-disulfide isomerase|uniref:Putative DsbA family dithiol-disulfide isomerase n=1 Tax=Ureibacillus thermosphaericus TaxID=51173 RepID=A0A840PPG3_URETH|nr:DsbA family oxidoreductase [Ureibacillus thermosphaericus]MBB5148379.1 putative DsbA family dithiol-disulfide isomerase [Ureibacillus thermosphaericus]NKZ31289.1 DsbA family oxidoreductase [Ureibacillus thermosphaericus]